jgi:lysophospholipase L1-like esterase
MTRKILHNGICAVLTTTIVCICGCSDGGGAAPAAPPDANADVLPASPDAPASSDVSPSSPDLAASIDGPGAGIDLASNVTVTLSETSFTFDTPDRKHTFVATVTGGAATSVTWSSSNTYIATVDATGVVTSVSGGQATITATSTADSSKSATATVSIAEPNRPRATTYADPKTITSGPINLLMCGDSLMRTYAANAGDQTGWGQVLSQFLSADATVDNSLANGGRSSRSFYNEVGRWDVAKQRLASAKAAGTPTFVFIMFGHNDQKKVTDTDGPSYLTFASQNPNGTVAGTYYDYLERYIVEARELGGIPLLLTPFVREYLSGEPPTVTLTGQHNITAAYTNEATARGDYPAAMKAVAAKHDVPLVDITTWSKALVEARAAAKTLDYIYIASDQTHVRNLGALLMAQEVVRALNAQGILSSLAKAAGPRIMLDSSTLSFGGLFVGTTADKEFRVTPFGDASGVLALSAPAGYTMSVDGGATFVSQTTIACDATYAGNVIKLRFTPDDAVAYNGDLTVMHSTLVPDYGNTVPNPKAGSISLTGNGKVAVSGAPATATWSMFSGTTISMAATTDGVITAQAATLVGLVNKNVANGAARFDTPDGVWPAESARNASRYIEFAVPVASGTFTLDSVSVGGGTGGGSNMRWDIVYSLTADFSAPTVLGSAVAGAKDTLVTSSYPGLGVSVETGQTLYLRVYPYNTSGAASGKSIMVANVVVSGVTN